MNQWKLVRALDDRRKADLSRLSTILQWFMIEGHQRGGNAMGLTNLNHISRLNRLFIDDLGD